MLKFYKAYMHGDKDDAWEYNETQELGFDTQSDAFGEFVYSLYEVALDMEVDTDTGEAKILGINGVKLERPVEA